MSNFFSIPRAAVGLVVSLVVVGAVAQACGEDRPTASAGVASAPATSSGGPPVDAAVRDANGEPDEVLGPELCNNVVQESQPIEEWGSIDAPKAPTGGPITRGKYVLNEVRAYGAVVDKDASDPSPPGGTGNFRRSTVYIGPKAFRFSEAAGTDADNLPADAVRAVSYIASGTNLMFTNVCGTEAGPASMSYSATAKMLTFHVGPTTAYVYRLVPPAP